MQLLDLAGSGTASLAADGGGTMRLLFELRLQSPSSQLAVVLHTLSLALSIGR
jgi:hypothetical protein